ncbi:tyrosine-type recombinase/integrase [Xylanimonas sp. McL0601]|uniref:tyrosine-type recombinase/integrase n=1 Tax=Xylanimonas sp. McL0601 TaxID=3414739 RepID=UPI003CED458F
MKTGRPRLTIGEWGKVTTVPFEYQGNRRVALAHDGRKFYRPDDVDRTTPTKADGWIARARVRDPDGRKREVVRTGTTKARAESALQKVLRQRKVEQGSISGEMLLDELANKWIAAIEAEPDGKKKQQSIWRYRIAVRNHIIPKVGALTLSEATTGRLDDFLSALRKVQPGTARHARTCLVQMFDLAVRHDTVPVNPARGTAGIPSSVKKAQALTPEQVTNLLRDLRDDESATRAQLDLIAETLLVTATRIGEVLALRWRDVDLDKGTVTIAGTTVRVSGEGLHRQGQTKTNSVTIHTIPAATVERLATLRDDLLGSDDDPVFPSEAGTLRDVGNVGKQWRRFASRHPEWTWVTTHTFRKTAATTIMRAEGLDAAAAALAHSNTGTTSRHYVEKAATRIDNSGLIGALIEGGADGT